MGLNRKTWCALAAAVTAACLLAGPAAAVSLETPDGGGASGDGRAMTPYAMWTYLPNKAWIAPDGDGAWRMVTDPERGNHVGAAGRSFFNGDLVAATVNLAVPEPDGTTQDRLELVDDWALVDRYLDPRDVGEVRVYAIDVETYEKPSFDGIETAGEDVTDLFDVTIEGTVTKAAAKAEYLELINARESAMQLSMLVPFTVNFDVAADILRDAEESGVDPGDVARNTCTDGDRALANRGGTWWEGEYHETNEPTLCIVRPELAKDVISGDAGDDADGGSHGGISIDGRTVMPGQTLTYELDLTVEKADEYVLDRLGLVDEYDPRTTPVKDSLAVIDRADGSALTDDAYVVDWDDGSHRFVIDFQREWLDANWDPSAEHRIGVTFEATVRTDIDWSTEPGSGAEGGEDAGDDDAGGEDAEDEDSGSRIVNRGWALLNNGTVFSNEVGNPVNGLNPSKDVTVEVGSESADGMSVYQGQTFLYQLNSSTLPAGRAPRQLTQWRIEDDFDETGDMMTGQWAVYAAEELHDTDGSILALQGARIAGSGFDSAPLGGDLFTMETVSTGDGTAGGLDDDPVNDAGNGTFAITATPRYLQLVSEDTAHPQGWRAYVQFTRVRAGEFANTFVETIDGARMPSNTVTTLTPERSPSIAVEKYDEASGPEAGDRDTTEEALEIDGDGTVIVFRITNTGDVPLTGLELTDETIAGDGEVNGLRYPEGWDTLVLEPGASVDVTGVLEGMDDGDAGVHTDRAVVRAVPVVACVPEDDPFDDEPAQPVEPGAICTDTAIESEPDDWNAYLSEPDPAPGPALPHTGGDVTWPVIAGAGGLLAGLSALGLRYVGRRRRRDGEDGACVPSCPDEPDGPDADRGGGFGGFAVDAAGVATAKTGVL